ncbi:MAG: T9SS type A sorting domain-containing protein [Saprospiraceae bacterium]|nr:T9SS type A sorting domain-containing protein [Saprospiraceae bacterium]
MKEVYSLRKQLLAALLLLACILPAYLGAQNATVSGRIYTEQGFGIEEYSIQIDVVGPDTPPGGPSFFTMDNNGEYSIELPIGFNYRITPVKDDNPLNGVTTYDLVLMSKHYHGLEQLNSPYKIIAADIDQSGFVNDTDSLEARKLILGIYNEFPQNTSWRFVRADYVFPNPADPFTPPFPESAVTGVLTGNIEDVDFIGVKIGDVNGSAITDGSPGGPTSNLSIAATGFVRIDDNNNCVADPDEDPLTNWRVVAQGSNGTYGATTFHGGQFYLFLPPGTYDVYLTAPNNLWTVCSDTIFGLVAPNTGGLDTLNFAAQPAYACPRMTVDLSTAFLRRCFSSSYAVYYCNQGTVVAEDVSIDVTFDSFLDIQSASIPWSSVNGNTYTFNVGDVQPGYCDRIDVSLIVSCDADLGQTHCSVAHIYPDSLCGPAATSWNGANLVVSGECQGDEVVFTITNTGEDMTDPVEYIVIEDIMIQMVGGPIQLNQNESETITVPANGSTWRLEVPQAVAHPFNQMVSAMVEACGVNNQGTVSLGIIPLFPTNDAGVFEDEDCIANIGSFDPNDKQGFPLGIGADHYIPKEQEIEYLIRFQNTGTDTAFNIVILDTLDQSLDLSSIRPGGSSHPYTYQLMGQGVLHFSFANIMLPDSNVNEAASHGFVQFAIRPKADLPDGTVIRNDAAIFFDFNLPVITNTTRHTLGNQFLNVSNVVFQPNLELEVFPNPTATSATFLLKSSRPGAGVLYLYDTRGALVRRMDFEHNQFELDVRDLQSGLYFFRLDTATGTPLAAGRLVRQD